MFVLEHSDGRNLDPVFENLKHSLEDFDILKACYAVYAEVLSTELINIRRRKNYAES